MRQARKEDRRRQYEVMDGGSKSSKAKKIQKAYKKFTLKKKTGFGKLIDQIEENSMRISLLICHQENMA